MTSQEIAVRYYRKIIRIKAEDSPNVRRALEYVRKGRKPRGEILVPGVITWQEYQRRRKQWNEVKQCIGLDAAFWKGKGSLMYPPDWLNRAEQLADMLRGRRRDPKAVGIDTAEGGDSTVMSCVDEQGLIEQVSKKTPNTAIIPGEVIAFGRKYNVPPEKWYFDIGGGGKEHADRLRQQGFNVQTVPFGESATIKPRRGQVMIEERIEVQEERAAFKNKRAEMYWLLRLRLDPSYSPGFAIPRQYTELRRQLTPVPLWYDDEGRIYLPPKQRRTGDKSSNQVTMNSLLGCSPDESDSLVLAVYGMSVRTLRPRAGAII